MNEKAKLINNDIIQYTTMCSGGQVKKGYYPLIFGGIDRQLSGDRANIFIAKEDIEITKEDIETGFMLFSALVYCSEPVALSQFLHSLLSTQSPRTIIQSTVNTIQSALLRENKNKDRVNQFYLALDKIFHFQFGKILLATSTPTQLQNIIKEGWPYFFHFYQDLDQCLKNINCQGAIDLIKSLGNTISSDFDPIFPQVLKGLPVQ